MSRGTFAEAYCAMHGTTPAAFADSVLRRALYPQARLLYPLLARLPGYFAPDREFISGVAHVTRLRDLDQEAFAYANDPANRGFLRRFLRLRVSAGRMGSLVRAALREGSRQPFAGPGAPPRSPEGG
jgi:hypothetical protein